MSWSELPPLPTGTLFANRYIAQMEIASGLASEVHFARQRDNGRLVAIKRLNVGDADRVAQISSFRAECLIVSSLRHRNTVQLHDYGYEDGVPYLVLEAVVGTTLGNEIAEHGPMAPPRAQRIVLQILDALDEAHSHGVLHRDIKPSNVMVAPHFLERDFVKVLDFGVASFRSRWAQESGRIAGTPFYLAPELTQSDSPTPASDLYSLGILAYELVVGTPPFRGKSAVEIMMKHASEPVPQLPRSVIDTPVGELIRAATEKRPNSRLGDVDAARLLLLGERRFATLPPPQIVRCSRLQKKAKAPRKPSSTIPIVVHRDEEERALRVALIEALKAPTPSVVLAVGPQGIGTTHLVNDVLDTTEFESYPRVLKARCDQRSPTPCTPLLDAFAEADPADSRDYRTHSLGPGIPLSSSTQVRRASRMLWSIAVEKPTILFLDDLHLADESTLLSLELWFHRGLEEPQKLVLLGTVSVSDSDTSRAFDQFLGRLVAQWGRFVSSVPVGPLDGHAVRDALRREVCEDEDVVTLIEPLINGRPDFLFQLYHHLVQDTQSRIEATTSGATLGKKGPAIRLPVSLRDLLVRRLSSVRTELPDLARLVECLAVLDASTAADLDALCELVAAAEDHVPGRIGELIRAGAGRQLLNVRHEGTRTMVELSSATLQRVVEHRLRDLGIWEHLNRLAARVLQQRHPQSLAALTRISAHLMEAQDVQDAYGSLLRASEVAREQGAEALAVRMLDRAHLKAQSVQLPTNHHVQLLALLGEAKTRVGIGGAAYDLHQQAIDGFEAIGPSEAGVHTRVSFARLLRHRGDLNRARSQLKTALREAVEVEAVECEVEVAFNLGELEAQEGDLEAATNMLRHASSILVGRNRKPTWAARINVALGDILAAKGDYVPAEQLINTATEEMRPLSDQLQILAECLRARARLKIRLGSLDEADGDLSEAIALLEKEGDALGCSRLLLERALVGFQARDFRRSSRYARKAKHGFAGLGSVAGEAVATAFFLRSLFQLGRHSEILDHAADALRINQMAGTPVDWASCAHFACRSHLRRGNGEAALEVARALSDHVQRHGLASLRANALLDLGESLCATERKSECVEAAREALALFEEQGSSRGVADATALLKRADGYSTDMG